MNNINIVYASHHVDTHAVKIAQSVITYHDLTIVLRGTLEYEINGERTVLSTGDTICLPPGVRRAREASAERADFISFNFTLEDDLCLPTKIEKALGGDILLLIAAYDEMARHIHSDIKEKCSHIVACILLILEDRVRQNLYSPLTIKIMEYLHANLASKITLEQIGEVTFFSPVYCDTVFRREVGSSIIDFLIDARIEEAKRLIASGAITLGDVSDATGFNDYNYFSRVFKKRTGYTPSEYKRITALGE